MGAGKRSKAGNRVSPAEGLFGTDRPGELHEGIYKSLIHAIASGRYPTGSRLPSEPDLAIAFSVSRPVVRQAIEKLKIAGLVISRPGSGTYVTGLDHLADLQQTDSAQLRAQLRDLQADLEFRLVYEPEAARIAAERHSEEDLRLMQDALAQFRDAHEAGRITHHFDYLFHEAIARATGNARFVTAARALAFALDATWLVIRHRVYFQPSASASVLLAEHEVILDHIRHRRAEAARDAMAQHIRASRLRLDAFVAELLKN